MTAIGQDPAGLEGFLAPQQAKFREVFGGGENPRAFFAPGRVNLIGEHVDYNGGPALPLAVERGTWVLARRRAGRALRLWAALHPGLVELDLERLPARPGGVWSDYAVGVARALGPARLPGLELLVAGDLPVGAGLSSSASLSIALALALDALGELGLGARGWVDAALDAERAFVGVPCGILDPYAIGFAREGHVGWVDALDGSHATLPVAWGGLALVVVESGVARRLADSGYRERVAECARALAALRRLQPEAATLREVRRETLEACAARLEPRLADRALHVLTEVERTFAARAALERGEPAALGPLLTASHRSLRDLYEVSCPELDTLVEDALACEGVLGARLMGAGFGGAALVLLREGALDGLAAAFTRGFTRRFGRAPRAHRVRAGGGPREHA